MKNLKLEEVLSLSSQCKDAKVVAKCLKLLAWEMQKLYTAIQKQPAAKKKVCKGPAKSSKVLDCLKAKKPSKKAKVKKVRADKLSKLFGLEK